jgi:ComF family protein
MNMDLFRLSKQVFRKFIKTLYPPRCTLCGADGFDDQDLCLDCFLALPWNRVFCQQCALPLPDGHSDDTVCGECLNRRPHFWRSLSLFRYEDDVVSLVHQLKFNEKLRISRLLGEMLADYVYINNVEMPDAIVPVPLSRKRLRQRGFNQSIEIARPLAQRWDIPVDTSSVKRIRNTQSQTGLDRKQRRKNIRGAFEMVGQPGVEHVAIIDDVVTTTSTVTELSRVLKRAGVKRVDVWSIARAG